MKVLDIYEAMYYSPFCKVPFDFSSSLTGIETSESLTLLMKQLPT